MTRPQPLHRLRHGLLVAALLVSLVTPPALAQEDIYLPLVTNGQSDTITTLLFRTQVTVTTTAQWRDLAQQEVVILAQGADWAQLLVDDEQLATLARLRYNPEVTNAVATLAAAQPTVRAALATLLTQAATLEQPLKTADPARSAEVAAARQALRTAMQALDTEQRGVLSQAVTVDSDNDGLSDDQEGWWCTNATNADSDGDRTNDGVEVAALRAWLNNQRQQFPETGKPFDEWPPDLPSCSDSDKDSVPDRAETFELGLNSNRESTDRDKFDDGQELFGQTNCTGQGGFCSYGPLPRNEDWGVIFAEMPSWVKAPGNHPLVAAFPVPEVDVVASSLKVGLVTTLTTEQGTITQKSVSYSTAKTEGTSDSIADSVTWNEWQEVTEALEEKVFDISASAISANTEDDPFLLHGQQRTDGWHQSKAFAQYKAACANYTAGAEVGIEAGGKAGVPFVAEGEVSVHANVSASGTELEGIGEYRCLTTLKSIIAQYPDLNEDYQPLLDYLSNKYSPSQSNPVTVTVNANFDMDNVVAGLSGMQLAFNQGTNLIGYRLHEIANVLAAPVRINSNTKGSERGGSRTVEHTTYEEHTITNGEQFTTGEDWRTATAIDSAHAADLTFNYKVRNTGTEYAREIGNLAFNLYIGDPSASSGQANPAYTYFVAPDLGGSGKFQNFMPNEEHTYTSRRIPLSLEQMKAIDLGGPIRIVVEDFTYGIDELFYQDAANAGLLIALEDGTDDGDETIDTYLIPTWGNEKVLNVLARYFPHETDADGTITAIWTPEYLSTTPAWCQSPRRPTDQPSKAVWCKHVLSTADWWNVYTDGLGDGSEGFQDAKAVPGATALFRFNKDSDLDGFSDRSEVRLGTDPKDAASFPRPEVLAGVHEIQVGNKVTATLSLLNSGPYDAYGVEAVLVAPDDSISITNNTVGGSGRVKALKQVIVGSSIKLPSPLSGNWTQSGHAVPAAGGYYSGTGDRTYTFTVAGCGAGGCTVGSGAWTLNWSDGAGDSGSLNFGTGYQSPTFLPVGSLGVTLAIYSGTVNNGDSFTVAARTPRDTFQYTINREPHTAPLVIVSYNDPQGNHRFVVPSQAMSLAAPTTDLTPYAGQMLHDMGVELVTTAPLAVGSNRVNLLVNNPSSQTLQDAHLFLELINISGTVVAEIPTQVTLPPGPTATAVTFTTAQFDPPYQAAEDYIVMAFLTDYQGNILDTAGRPLSSFQVDPLPALAADENTLTWDFGTVAQGTLLQHQLAIANQGFGRLYTYLPPTPGLSLSGAGQRTVGAADSNAYLLRLNTLAIPLGPYSQTMTLKTNDPALPALQLTVVGTVTSGVDAIPASVLQRPLDVAVVVTGTHNQGEWIEYTHTMGPDASSLHPVRVYSQDYTKLWGVGKVAAPFSQGTTAAIFGTGADGDQTISGDVTFDVPRSPLGATSLSAGTTTLLLNNASGFEVGEEIFIYQVQGSTAGTYEFARIAAVVGNTLTVAQPLVHSYTHNSPDKVQVIVVPNYHNVTVTATGRWQAPAWDGNSGGLLIFRATGEIRVEAGGVIEASGKGFRGGTINCVGCSSGNQGEGYGGIGSKSIQNYLSGGGGGQSDPSPSGGSGDASGGGGGGHGTPGINGVNGRNTAGGGAGTAVGANTPTQLFFGGGGGAGGAGDNGGREGGVGGNGSGLILLSAEKIVVNGTIVASGQNGSHGEAAGGGGGGAGGAVYISGSVIQLGNNTTSAAGGTFGTGSDAAGGNGGSGRIFIDYCNTLTGSTNPAAVTQQIDCYIADQNTSAANAASAQTTTGFDMFGDGRDGVMPGSGNLDYAQGFAAGSVNGTAGATTLTVTDQHNIARVNPGDVILLHQTQGAGGGNWELNQAADDFTGSGTFTLAKPLAHNYSSSGADRAQVLRVPQYSTCGVTGTVTPLAAWDGNWGGIFAVMCNGTMNVSGQISANGNGYRGGQGGQWCGVLPCPERGPLNRPGGGFGESYSGSPQLARDEQNRNSNTNGGAGVGGEGRFGGGGATGGGGASHNTSGTPGQSNSGAPAGATYGNSNLAQILFGSGGGGGGKAPNNDYNSPGGNGGVGGGIILIFARDLNINAGSVYSSGTNGGGATNTRDESGGGGGGSGGSVLLSSMTMSIGSNRIVTSGGTGGSGSKSHINGGNGGDGRIRIEYCESLTGTTNPPASTQQIDCYRTEQTAPSTFRLNLPEAVNGAATYNVQFGRKLDFTAAGTQVTTLRLPAGMVSSAYLDALVSGLPANATLILDIGNNGTVEFQADIANNSTNQTANLGAALTAYWHAQGSRLTGTLDVPIKVTLSQPGQVLLTNLRVQTVGSQVRHVRLPVETYTTFTLDFTLGTLGTVALDIGDNGSIDWSTNATTPRQVTGNLATAINAYLSGKSGTVDLPLRVYVNPHAAVTLNDYTATISRKADLVAQQIIVDTPAVQAAAPSGTIEEGESVTVRATLRNSGNLGSGPITAAFFANAAGWGDWYIGSTFVEHLAAGATVEISTLWNTTGFSGTVPVKVVVNPYGRTAESNYSNNSKTTAAAVFAPALGDINGEGNIDIFDLQRLINMILHPTQPDPALYPLAQWRRGNLAADEAWNVFDLQRLINTILGQQATGE